ncbi:MAG: enoyl-CoA hydratase/isomerase family protein, partial [Arcobacteraceae bacterium]
ADVITISSLHKNAGAGGVFLALSCDYVVGKENVVLNPHYKTLGLSGSEYHTYTLPKRVGKEKAKELLENCLPISIQKAKKIALVDEVFKAENYFDTMRAYAQSFVEDEERYDDFILNKQEDLEKNQNFINSCKENELKIMHSEFWDENSSFHKLLYDFVYKVVANITPTRLQSQETK